MKLKPTTLILMLIAVGLGSFVYFHEVQRDPEQAATQKEERPIFGFKEDQVQSFTVKTQGQTLEFAKSQATQPKPAAKTGSTATDAVQPVSAWSMKQPKAAPADEASVAYLLNLLATGKSDRTLTVPANQLSEFGLDKPSATVEVKLNNQATHRLVLGKPDFNQTYLYAQADPPAQATPESTVLLVSPSFTDAVNRPLSEWQQSKPKNEGEPEKTGETGDRPSASPSPDVSTTPEQEAQ